MKSFSRENNCLIQKLDSPEIKKNVVCLLVDFFPFRGHRLERYWLDFSLNHGVVSWFVSTHARRDLRMSRRRTDYRGRTTTELGQDSVIVETRASVRLKSCLNSLMYPSPQNSEMLHNKEAFIALTPAPRNKTHNIMLSSMYKNEFPQESQLQSKGSNSYQNIICHSDFSTRQ
ncbi:hypothetical protein RRG08_055672 [Elysia crispata]|uniref:Uncharacterized protein n=1 Tax=Elysia crispata TaxID=231223 RepID=A0AAE1DBM5_9GAST|nr:hypothetical protein RRG08_055672 [Elysia crispata]